MWRLNPLEDCICLPHVAHIYEFVFELLGTLWNDSSKAGTSLEDAISIKPKSKDMCINNQYSLKYSK